MKIVLACRVFPTHRPGGMPFCVQDRARALAAAGHEVHVLTTALHGHAGSMENDQGAEIHYMPCASGVLSEAYAEHCRRHCMAWEPEIVHLDSLDVNRRWWRELPHKPRTALTLHGFCLGAFLTEWNLSRTGYGSSTGPKFDFDGMMKERYTFNTFQTVIGVSRHEHWMLQDMFGLKQAKLVYNPIPDYFFHGDNTNWRTRWPLPKEKRFICVGISGHAKRMFDVAATAASRVGVKLDVISNKSRRYMVAEYDNCTALVLPTMFSQGYDLSVAEALARFRPVICSATGSYLREAEHRQGLVTVPLDDPKALAAAMLGPLPEVAAEDAIEHYSENHVTNWLKAVME